MKITPTANFVRSHQCSVTFTVPNTLHPFSRPKQPVAIPFTFNSNPDSKISTNSKISSRSPDQPGLISQPFQSTRPTLLKPNKPLGQSLLPAFYNTTTAKRPKTAVWIIEASSLDKPVPHPCTSACIAQAKIDQSPGLWFATFAPSNFQKNSLYQDTFIKPGSHAEALSNFLSPAARILSIECRFSETWSSRLFP